MDHLPFTRASANHAPCETWWRDEHYVEARQTNSACDIKLGQYYTRQEVARCCYDVFRQHYDPTRFQMVEPSAGTGSFSKLLPPGSLAYDIDPKLGCIIAADFLTTKIESYREVAIIGNPPFGKNAGMAVKFFNHSALQCSVIAFILPLSFRKASIVNRLDAAFHLVREETIPAIAFQFRGKPYHVPTAFQIWERRPTPRPILVTETRHPDFEFTAARFADFAIQRVGARAGRVHHDLSASPSAHYFISGDVEDIMMRLDFGSVTGNVAGNPSLSKSEIVALYRQYTLR